MTIKLRETTAPNANFSTKNQPLTNGEVDANFIELRNLIAEGGSGGTGGSFFTEVTQLTLGNYSQVNAITISIDSTYLNKMVEIGPRAWIFRTTYDLSAGGPFPAASYPTALYKTNDVAVVLEELSKGQFGSGAYRKWSGSSWVNNATTNPLQDTVYLLPKQTSEMKGKTIAFTNTSCQLSGVRAADGDRIIGGTGALGGVRLKPNYGNLVDTPVLRGDSVFLIASGEGTWHIISEARPGDHGHVETAFQYSALAGTTGTAVTGKDFQRYGFTWGPGWLIQNGNINYAAFDNIPKATINTTNDSAEFAPGASYSFKIPIPIPVKHWVNYNIGATPSTHAIFFDFNISAEYKTTTPLKITSGLTVNAAHIEFTDSPYDYPTAAGMNNVGTKVATYIVANVTNNTSTTIRSNGGFRWIVIGTPVPETVQGLNLGGISVFNNTGADGWDALYDYGRTLTSASNG